MKGGFIMAGKFIKNSSMLSTAPNFIVSNVKSSINNPYYLFNNSSASICTYYNINTTMTTLDEATRGNYAEISPESPIRYNKISGFYIYGINRIDPSMEVGEFGLETSGIQDDAMILPNTIIPYPGDFFVLDQIEKQYLFKVTAVNPAKTHFFPLLYILKWVDGSLLN